MIHSENYKNGLKKLKLFGPPAEDVIEELSEVSADLVRYTVEFMCGDIYSRPGLGTKIREMVSIAALTVLGNSPAQLKIHIEAALREGCSQTEIKEIIIQMAILGGFPASVNAMLIAKEVFANYSE